MDLQHCIYPKISKKESNLKEKYSSIRRAFEDSKHKISFFVVFLILYFGSPGFGIRDP
jgi:hypothetical protein